MEVKPKDQQTCGSQTQTDAAEALLVCAPKQRLSFDMGIEQKVIIIYHHK